MNRQTLFLFLSILLAVGILAVYFFIFRSFILPKVGNEIVVSNQDYGESITVDKVKTKEIGFLVAEVRGQYIGSDTVIGNVYIERPDTYTNFIIPILSPVPEDQIKPEIDARLTLYKDVDGNGAFNEAIDIPIRDLSGDPVRVKFKLYYNE